MAAGCGQSAEYSFTCSDGREMSVPAAEYEDIAIASAAACRDVSPAASSTSSVPREQSDDVRVVCYSDGSEHRVDLSKYGSMAAARNSVCPTTTTTTTLPLGKLDNPIPADGTVDVTLADDQTGDTWSYTIVEIRVLDGLDDPTVKTLGAAPEELADGNVLVAATINLRHDSGLANETYPPFSVFLVTSKGRTIDQQYNVILDWSDDSSIYPPTLPPGTNGLWTPVFQVAAEVVGKPIVAVQVWGGEPQYFVAT